MGVTENEQREGQRVDNQLECSPIADHYELMVTASSHLAVHNARRVYSVLEFKRNESGAGWIARAHLAPKGFAERIAGRLALVDGIVIRLKNGGS